MKLSRIELLVAEEDEDRFAGFLDDVGVVEKPSVFEGRSLIMILAPKQEKPEKKEPSSE